MYLFQATVAGLIAVLISCIRLLLLVLQAGQATHAMRTQTASWVWAISIGAGVGSVVMRFNYKIPLMWA